ncbi:hypothetical protein HFN98_18030 [Rhizobium laguerreae]|uniref:hypothetical protein n=1 Tax=Rhizobium laguerreae TaxID=1076926 RepID=UPI001C912047|nr:hypothetical protein [Rhizobium laguerreae]MBY3332509.1 hypothetical protein [Rhizobium laguerreae]
MENDLRQSLLATARIYGELTDCALSTVSRRVKNNASFFSGIADPSKSFTARTYDEVMRWFADNWPNGAQIPLDLMRWMVATEYQGGVVA